MMDDMANEHFMPVKELPINYREIQEQDFLTMPKRWIVKDSGMVHSGDPDTMTRHAILGIMDKHGALKQVNRFTTKRELIALCDTFVCGIELGENAWVMLHGCDYVQPQPPVDDEQRYLIIGWAWKTPWWPLIGDLTTYACKLDLFSNYFDMATEQLQNYIVDEEEADEETRAEVKAEPWNSKIWRKEMCDTLYRRQIISGDIGKCIKRLRRKFKNVSLAEKLDQLETIVQEMHKHLGLISETSAPPYEMESEEPEHQLHCLYWGEDAPHLDREIGNTIDSIYNNHSQYAFFQTRRISQGRIVETSDEHVYRNRAILRLALAKCLDELSTLVKEKKLLRTIL